MNDCSWASYSTNRLVQHEIGLELLSMVQESDWKEDDVILDIGCGTGEITRMMAERDNVKEIIGIDISSKAIEFARLNNSIEGKTRYLVADFRKIKDIHSEFQNAFTKVYSNMSLHWMENTEKIFQYIFWCLKEDGVAVCNLGQSSTLLTIYDNYPKLKRWTKYVQDFDPGIHVFSGNQQDMWDIATWCGFKTSPRVIKSSSKQYILETRERVKGHLKPLMGPLESIPTSLQDDFLEDCCDLFYDVASKTEDRRYLWRHLLLRLMLKK
ncbi:juvenile hormone acid O-methyltransferase-like [Ptychodera flava]|uniref:juvenile hormone acid O-methyltransferase-like n=1 Tax=Ptychodera flava TaxID=63121 RepID=UPI00396A2569